jgi:hypothetical protein
MAKTEIAAQPPALTHQPLECQDTAPVTPYLDILLIDKCSNPVLQLPVQSEAPLWPPLDDGQAQVTELVLALHVVLACQSRVLQPQQAYC